MIAAFKAPGVSCDFHKCGATVSDVYKLPHEMISAAKSVQPLWDGKSYWEKYGFTYLGTTKTTGNPDLGDVVVMPTMGGGDGHVGISLGNGWYYSNLNGKLTRARVPAGAMVYRRIR